MEPAAPQDDVRLRTLVVGDLPLLVASVARVGTGARLADALADRGVPELPGFLGVELPRGARVGFLIDASEMRLVDEHETTLLRVPRRGLDREWIEAARRLRGTMTVLAVDLEFGPETGPDELVRHLETAAREGRTRGAIVGVAEDRPTLPLMLG